MGKKKCAVCEKEIGGAIVTLNDHRGYRATYCSGQCLVVDAVKRGVAPRPHNADFETLTGDDKLLR
jgi:DNA-directed RNA polymerase subunit RPC12/RpoP